MADDEPEELVFDASVKKKKKKKKKEPVGEEAEPAAEDGADAEADDFGAKKKKKKKKKVPALEEDGDGAATTDKMGNTIGAADDGSASAAGMFDKKKKKKKKAREEVDPEDDDGADADSASASAGDSSASVQASNSGASSEGPAKSDAPAWADSDRDYTYEEMLVRVYQHLGKTRQPTGSFRMKPPSVHREGSKKVVLINFPDICNCMNRPADHVLSFMLAELGTSGSLDAAQRVTFKGIFKQQHIEVIVRKYLKEYVLCKLCKSPETTLVKDSNTRLYFMTCNVCSASRSVAPIKSGYQAQIGRRKRK